jgi:hypothetical protein
MIQQRGTGFNSVKVRTHGRLAKAVAVRFQVANPDDELPREPSRDPSAKRPKNSRPAHLKRLGRVPQPTPIAGSAIGAPPANASLPSAYLARAGQAHPRSEGIRNDLPSSACCSSLGPALLWQG